MASLDRPTWQETDVTLHPETSGIGIKNATDNGLSIDEEPLELGGSAFDALEIPEDDDVVGRQIAQVEAYFGPFLTAEQVGEMGTTDTSGDDDGEL